MQHRYKIRCSKNTMHCIFWFFLLNSLSVAATEKTLMLYHDADWSNNIESANAIWQGVHVALAEVNYRVQGYRIQLVKKDHRGNVLRSKRNLDAFLKDENALAVISGMHSPPLIKYRKYINQNKILTLVPWAAGGSITRYPSPDNWIFRLSVDDTKAGAVLVDHAVNALGCKSPHLFLENGPWGQSNLKNINIALREADIQYRGVTRFGRNLRRYDASSKLIAMTNAGADCVLLVAGVYEGAQIANAMAGLGADMRLPIISHWGITGGSFHQQVEPSQRKKISLYFIQSCFSFLKNPLSLKGQSVFENAQHQFPEEIATPKDIRSPVGFVHGYDITQLLLEALRDVNLDANAASRRNDVRLALENIKRPVVGLVKEYSSPYRKFSPSDLDAHEALSVNDYCMAYYNGDNDIILAL